MDPNESIDLLGDGGQGNLIKQSSDEFLYAEKHTPEWVAFG